MRNERSIYSIEASDAKLFVIPSISTSRTRGCKVQILLPKKVLHRNDTNPFKTLIVHTFPVTAVLHTLRK
jgi:hypothetical protein